MPETRTLRAPDDFHVHLRQEPELSMYAKASEMSFARILAMPNTVPPLTTPERVSEYIECIKKAAPRLDVHAAFKLAEGMNAGTIEALRASGAIAGKYYPAGATTNSGDGVSSPEKVSEALETMEALGIPLSVHAEDPSAPVLERERAFIPTLEAISARFPKLKIVFEHVSSAEGIAFIENSPQTFAATVTAHHLLLTIDDLAGGSLNPHLFCKPILKTARDREAILNAVLSGSPKFFFGSDSAPHPIRFKESAHAPGGIYSAPTALAAVAGVFFTMNKPDEYEWFTSINGAAFYGLEPNRERIKYSREPWKVPNEVHGAVPFLAGETLKWRIVGIFDSDAEAKTAV